MYVFHTVTALGAVLMIVFAAGLYRRLHAGMRDSIAPAVAAAGLVGTAVVSILGSGLNTEFASRVGGTPVGFQNAAIVAEQRFQAASSYSMRPPRIGRRQVLSPT